MQHFTSYLWFVINLTFVTWKLQYIFREMIICTVWKTKPILMPAVRISLFFLYCKIQHHLAHSPSLNSKHQITCRLREQQS